MMTAWERISAGVLATMKMPATWKDLHFSTVFVATVILRVSIAQIKLSLTGQRYDSSRLARNGIIYISMNASGCSYVYR